MKNERGQSLVESTLVLLLFCTILLGVMDVAQVLFSHESLVERVNAAVRWGATHSWNGPEPIRNFVLYGAPDEPKQTGEGYLGLTADNVAINYAGSDELLTVQIVNFQSHLFTPGIAQTLVSPRPVLVSMPVLFSPQP